MYCKRITLLITLVCICLLSKAITTENVTSNVDGFLENQGQMMDIEGNPVPFVLFKTEAPGVNIWITEEGITMQTFNVRKEPLTGKELEDWKLAGGESSGRKNSKKFIDWERIDLTLKDASIKKENIIKENATQGHSNFFYHHCPDGIYGVKEYQKITIQNVYPNIDWVIYRTAETFKYDFIVHPGGDYKQIELLYHSKTPIEINENGQLAFTTDYGNLKENKPVSFYEDKEVSTKFIQNHQHIKKINGDLGYETSIGFNLPLKISTPLTDLVIDPQLFWSTLYGGFDNEDAECNDVDANGNVFISGVTESSNFPKQNPFFGAYFQGVYGTSGDLFILKFNNNGNRIWATYYGGSGGENAFSLNIDNNDNVFITGTSNSPNFPLQNAGTYYQSSFNDMFILKFNNNGNRLWATYYGGSNTEVPSGMDIDINDNIIITGYTYSTDLPVQNAGTFFQGSLTNPGYCDAFIVKFDNAGNMLWATYYGGSDNDIGLDVEADNTGNLFFTGYTRSTNFPLQNSGTYYQNSHAGGLEDVYIIKFDNLGNRIWATYYGGNGGALDEERPESIITDSNGNLFVLGHTFSTNFPLQNAGTYYQGVNAGLRDMFILKFDNTGNRIWGTYYGGVFDDYNLSTPNPLAIDNCDNLYVSFLTYSPNLPVVSPKPSSYTSNYNLQRDGYIARFTNSGNLTWATYWGGDNNEERGPIAIDQNDNLFIAGTWSFVSSSPSTYSYMDPGNGAYFDNTYNGGYADLFIAKFISDTTCAPVVPPVVASYSLSSTTICQGGSITFTDNSTGTITNWNWTFNGGNPSSSSSQGPHSVTFPSPGTFNVTLQVSDGISIDDTTIIINVIPLATSTDIITSCTPITWIDGNTYSSTTNTPTFTISGGAANGCDSIVTLDLTINSNATSTDVITSCTPITWIDGNTYSSTTNTPTFTISGGAANGCDSIVTLDLTINTFVTGTDIITSCTPITWIDGNTYSSTTNTPTFTISGGAANGCDSIVTLDLTINTFVTGTDIITSCTPITWIDGNTYSSTTNTPTFTISGGAANGCDSVVTLDLTINSFVTGTDIITSCTPITWIDGNTYSSTTNTPTFTISGGASNGCDSVVSLDLTINSFVTGTDIITSCTPITWIDGNTYSSTTNTPTFTIVGGASNGCDSVVSLDLTINSNATSTDVITSCAPITWIDGNTYSSTTNTPTFTISGGAANGCDSIVTLNYTLNSGSTTSQTINECEGFSITIGSNTYTTSGVYIDVLNGCDTLITDLSISDDCESVIFIPNVLSPNGDNKNDLFLVQLVGVEFINLEVYNRWGLLMFETNNINEGWDGKTTSGTDAPDGTYFYILNYKDKDQVLTKKGPLTLIK